MKRNKTIDYFIKDLSKNFDSEFLKNIKKDAYLNYQNLKKKYANDSKSVQKLTLNNMFPVISLYKSMLKNGLSKDISLELLNKINCLKKLKSAKSTAKIFRLFNFYKLYPSIFKKVTLNSFNEKNGFQPEFVVSNNKQCKFNMKKCLFCERCKAEGCFELVPVFCNTDIVFNENLHKNIVWKREKTLAQNDEYCDFDVSLK